jgi:hypothetical protein
MLNFWYQCFILCVLNEDTHYKEPAVDSDVDEAPVAPWCRVEPKHTEFVLGSFEPDSVVLAKGNVLVPCYEMWE